jgi:hypothetical protein
MTSALTRFGKHCRDLRSVHGKTMGDQADALGCAVHFISEIESGKIAANDKYVCKFRDWLGLSDQQYRDLMKKRGSDVIQFPPVKFIRNNSNSMRLFRKISKMNPSEIRGFPKSEAQEDG